MAWSSTVGGLYVFGGLDSSGVAAKCKSNQDANLPGGIALPLILELRL